MRAGNQIGRRWFEESRTGPYAAAVTRALPCSPERLTWVPHSSPFFIFSFSANLASQRSGSSLNAAAQPEQQTGYDFPLYSTCIVPRPPEMMHLGPGLSLSATAKDVPTRCWRTVSI